MATSSTQFFRQVGNTVGVAIFGAVLINSLAIELPKQLPQIEGGADFSMSQAQANAMNPEAMQERVEARFDAYTPIIESAFAGDRAAATEVVNNPLMAEALKAPLVTYLSNKEVTEVPDAQRYLAAYRLGVDAQVQATVETIQQGTRTAFSNAITSMFSTSLWICLLGLLVTLFIPVISLGAHEERD